MHVKGFFNALADPRLFFILALVSLVVDGLAARAGWRRTPSATACSSCWAVFFIGGAFDPNFRLIITKPDNVPIVGLIFLLIFLTWFSMREAVLNDRRIAAGEGPIEKAESDRVWVWPDLVYTELICADRLLGRADRVVDLPEGAARTAGQPVGDAEPVEGALVLPRPAGNARLLRSLAGGRGPARRSSSSG